METNSAIEVQFHCRQCQADIGVTFKSEQFTTVLCPQCDYSYSLMRPTIGEEILLDWEKEAIFQKSVQTKPSMTKWSSCSSSLRSSSR